MADRLSSAEFARRHDLPDWRILAPGDRDLVRGAVLRRRGRLHRRDRRRWPRRPTTIPTSTSATGACTCASPATTPDGLTDRDGALAATISELAAARGISAEPRASTRLEVAIDALDIDAVRPVLAGGAGLRGRSARRRRRRALDPRPGRHRARLLVPADGRPSPASATASTSTSIVPDDEVDDRIEAALAAGGTHGQRRLRPGPSGSWPTPRATRPASAPGRTAAADGPGVAGAGPVRP